MSLARLQLPFHTAVFHNIRCHMHTFSSRQNAPGTGLALLLELLLGAGGVRFAAAPLADAPLVVRAVLGRDWFEFVLDPLGRGVELPLLLFFSCCQPSLEW